MSRPISNSHVIKDPVHGTMRFLDSEDRWLKPFIDSPNFQRLRHIKQLGMTDYIFPGAVHTRFNHSLGCSFVAREICQQLSLEENERQLVMIACLLHDIGHGPFSHTFEDIFHQKLIRHEDWTPFFLDEYHSEDFFDQYNLLNKNHTLSVKKFQNIKNMIMHHAYENSLLRDIVSSQLDADRLDYLLRDSHFCGVQYGAYDFSWMLNSMVSIKTKKGERLGITYKGIGVVEHYLMARRLMLKNIYLHQKKLAYEFYLIQFLKIIARELNHATAFSTIKKTRLGAFLLATNHFNEAPTQKNKQQFLKNNFANYKELTDYDIFNLIKYLVELDLDHEASILAKRLHYRIMPKIFRFDREKILDLEVKINDFKKTHRLSSWQLAIIDTPHLSYTKEQDPILILDENAKVKPLSEMSIMIDAIAGLFEETAFLCIDQSLMQNKILKKLLHSYI